MREISDNNILMEKYPKIYNKKRDTACNVFEY